MGDEKNIVLIGMPSSGKSTVGALLAEQLNRGFLDTDQLIKDITGKTPKDIVSQDGLNTFLQTQEAALLSIKDTGLVVATGGSVVYNIAAMDYLKSNSVIVYLKNDLEDIEARLGAGRRFARKEGQGIKELYEERVPLYEKYSDVTVYCKDKSPMDISGEIRLFI